MDVLKGLLLINDIDPFDAYGAFLAEDKPGDMKNYSSLLTSCGQGAEGGVAAGTSRRDGSLDYRAAPRGP